MRPSLSQKYSIVLLKFFIALFVVLIAITVVAMFRRLDGWDEIKAARRAREAFIGRLWDQLETVRSGTDNFIETIFEEAVASNNAELNHSLCIAAITTNRDWRFWRYGTYPVLRVEVDVCERAIELEPSNAIYHDTHGLSLLMRRVNDLSPAIVDFQFYLDWLRSNDLYDEYGLEREALLNELLAGENPLRNRHCRQRRWRSYEQFRNPEYQLQLPCEPEVIPVD